MALNVWTQPSGYSFGLVQEKVTISLSLPTSNDSGVTYQIISGALPRGLTIQGNSICLLYTSPSPRDRTRSRMPSSA